MNNTWIKNLGIVLLSLGMASCEVSKEEAACKVAKEFTEAFYNLDVKKARGYCHRDLHAIMDFRHTNLRQSDRDFLKASGKVDVRVIKYESDVDNMVFVDMEIRNALKIDYMADTLSICPCDTLSLTIKKFGVDKWYVTEFFKGVPVNNLEVE